MNLFKFDQLLELDNQKLSRQYLQTLNKEQRQNLIIPIFNLIRSSLPDFPFPDDSLKLNKEWKRILDFQPDLSSNEIYNNSSIGTYICKYFCHDFYNSVGDKNKRTMKEIFFDDDLMKKLIANRLGLSWYEESPEEAFNLSPKMLIQGMRSMALVSSVTTFKITVAKYMTLKYSNENETILDYSAGWGARMLGAASCNIKYIGLDPLTIPDLIKMKNYFNLSNIELIQTCSEHYKNKENSVDFSYSSPPYFNQEVYSNDQTQAYNKGENYFYNIYWKQTLSNIKYMLKPNKWFGLNIINYPKMIDLAKLEFGDPIEIIKLKTTRSHLNKSQGKEVTKFEPIYMFINKKD